MKITPNNPLKLRRLVPALFAWWALAVTVMAQAPGSLPGLPPPARAEGPQPNIAKISIVINGPQQISDDAILAHLSVREGMPFDAALLERSYDSLMETGLYDDIQTSRESVDANNVRVIITLTPNARISAVVFDGNKATQTYVMSLLLADSKFWLQASWRFVGGGSVCLLRAAQPPGQQLYWQQRRLGRRGARSS